MSEDFDILMNDLEMSSSDSESDCNSSSGSGSSMLLELLNKNQENNQLPLDVPIISDFVELSNTPEAEVPITSDFVKLSNTPEVPDFTQVLTAPEVPNVINIPPSFDFAKAVSSTNAASESDLSEKFQESVVAINKSKGLSADDEQKPPAKKRRLTPEERAIRDTQIQKAKDAKIMKAHRLKKFREEEKIRKKEARLLEMKNKKEEKKKREEENKRLKENLAKQKEEENRKRDVEKKRIQELAAKEKPEGNKLQKEENIELRKKKEKKHRKKERIVLKMNLTDQIDVKTLEGDSEEQIMEKYRSVKRAHLEGLLKTCQELCVSLEKSIRKLDR